MYNSNNFALSKDTIFGAKNHTNINSVLNNSSVLEEISVSKAKETLTKNLLTPREVMQVLSNWPGTKDRAKNAELNRKIFYILFINILCFR